MRNLMMSGVALVAMTASALAADLPSLKAAPEAPPPVFSWTGFHLGAGVGVSALQVSSKSTSFTNANFLGVVGGTSAADLGKFGVFGTLEAGADMRKDQYVFGAFTDFDISNLRANSSSRTNLANNNYMTQNVSYRVRNVWDIGARLGYLLDERDLVYGLAGVSMGSISSSARIDAYVNGNHNFVQSGKSQWKAGLLLGVGWEHALTDHVSVKTEYRFADYGSAKSSLANGNSIAQQSGVVMVQSVRVGLNYHF